MIWLEWLGEERPRPEVMGPITRSREVHIFRMKNHVICDGTRVAAQWSLPGFKNSYFLGLGLKFFGISDPNL